MKQSFSRLRLKMGQEKRLKAGHLWIYSNEVDVAHTPLTGFERGEVVIAETYQGKALGFAYINPNLLLCARLLTDSIQQPFDRKCIMQRIQQALRLRDHYFSQPFYRLIYGESDGLPGLVVDRYGDYLVMQVATSGMERLQQEIVAALTEVLDPRGILLKNDSSSRTTEGLPVMIDVAFGAVPEQIETIENGCRFHVSPWKGQKTGWFYDQRDNRAWVQRIATGKSVLDLCSYVGGFGIAAAVSGARHVYAVDSSAQAIERVQHNARLNDVADKVQAEVGDVADVAKKLIQEGRRFDIVLVDPPAFIKKRKDMNEGRRAYQRLNKVAMQLVAPEGVLVSSSCSLHFSREMLTEAILQGAVSLNRRVQIIGQGYQSADHPVHPAIAETNYLKTLFCYVS